MNIIISYLDTMFSAYPQTPRLREAKAELRGMMEDAYASLIAAGNTENEAIGQVIRDFGNLDEVAPALGIASDVTPPLASTETSATRNVESSRDQLAVTITEAHGYSAAKHNIRFRVTTAVVLFVLSPAVLIGIIAAGESGVVAITEEAATFIGLLVLFALTAIGVSLLIATSRETAPFKRISDGNFTTDPIVTLWAQEQAEQHEPSRIRAMQIAIVLWILSPVPVVAFALLLADTPQENFWTSIGTALTLGIVAAGLGVLLPNVWAHSASEKLSQGARGYGANAYGINNGNSVVGVIAAFYWPLLTAIYLAWSFIGNAWDISWIIWPIGAVLFAAIAGGISALENYRKTGARNGTASLGDS
ncbi:MAG: permease prefix domain 1-containing protein [Microbacteriaceae bacterium]